MIRQNIERKNGYSGRAQYVTNIGKETLNISKQQ
jgi:hypothetical protein